MARGIASVLFASAWVAVGCAWYSGVPEGRPPRLPENAPTEIVTLALCEPFEAVLDCKQHSCNDWYRVLVESSGELRLSVELDAPDGPGALARVLLRPLGQPVLVQQVSNQGEPIEIRQHVEPDVYAVLVQGGGSRRSYRIRVSMTPAGAPESAACAGAEAPAGR